MPNTNFADQEYLSDPDAGIVGDCWRACIANLVGRPRANVPHFVERFDDWLGETKTWLMREYGEELHWWPPTFPFDEASRPNVILMGPSPRTGVHAVLADAHTGEIVHDPHPSRGGLLSVSGAFVTAVANQEATA